MSTPFLFWLRMSLFILFGWIWYWVTLITVERITRVLTSSYCWFSLEGYTDTDSNYIHYPLYHWCIYIYILYAHTLYLYTVFIYLTVQCKYIHDMTTCPFIHFISTCPTCFRYKCDAPGIALPSYVCGMYSVVIVWTDTWRYLAFRIELRWWVGNKNPVAFGQGVEVAEFYPFSHENSGKWP